MTKRSKKIKEVVRADLTVIKEEEELDDEALFSIGEIERELQLEGNAQGPKV